MEFHPKLEVCETAGVYRVSGDVTSEEIFTIAAQLASLTLAKGTALTAPADALTAIRSSLLKADVEHFVMLFLDHQHRVIALEELSTGTVSAANVYIREVVRRSLHHNASALIVAHNHPSGNALPSRADERITKDLKGVLQVVGINLLDHFIVTDSETSYSFAEHGNL